MALLALRGTVFVACPAPDRSLLPPLARGVRGRGRHGRRRRPKGDGWTSPPDGAAIDPTDAVWSGADDSPIHVEGGEGLCWRGGEIRGSFDDRVTWEELHATGAFNLVVPGATVADLRIHNYGDGIRVLDEADDLRILDVHLSFAHDDCMEDSLVRLEPMPTVYRGRAPGDGGFFKWDEEGRSPRLVLEGNVFRAYQDANHTSMGMPDGTSCRDNTMVWLGGPYPEQLPDCFEVTTDARVWDEAVARWHAAR